VGALLLLLGGTASVGGEPGVVGELDSGQGSGEELVLTVPPSGVALGSRVVVGVGTEDEVVTISVTDARGNTYAADALVANPGLSRAIIFSAHVGTALQAGDAITIAATGPTDLSAAAVAFTSISEADPVDVTATATGSSNSPSSGTATTTVANTLLIGAVCGSAGADPTLSAGSGWTGAGSANASQLYLFLEYRTAPAAGGYVATFGSIFASDWAAALVAYQG
jgi:hypothetical protein